jgi:hypothetical protein
LCTFYTKGPSTSKKKTKKKKNKKTTTKPMSEKGRLACVRHELGIKCKRLINECRRKEMFETHEWVELKLVEYVDSNITPENQLLIGVRHNTTESRTTTNPPQQPPTLPPRKRRRTAVARSSTASLASLSVLSLSTSIFFFACILLCTCPCWCAFAANVPDEPPIQSMPSSSATYVPPNAPPARPELDKDNYVVPPSDTPEIPRTMMETGVDGIGVDIQVGMLVIRGPDWRYGRQDGGSVDGDRGKKRDARNDKKQRIGKVVEIRQWITNFNGTDGTTSGEPVTVPGSVRVQWSGSKQVNVYRYGAENKWDVRVIDQMIHDVNWDSVMDEMADDYRLPSQRKSLHDSITTSPEDLVVLKAMYNEMNGYRWRAKVGWVDRFGPPKRNTKNKTNKNTTTLNDRKALENDDTEEQKEEEAAETMLSDPCRDHWSGITCNTKSKPARVFAIDLSNNGLSGTLPRNMGNMTYLKTIALSNNRLTGTLPDTLGGCAMLEYLSMEINRFEGSIPRSFGRLSGLKWLSVYNNQLSGTVPRELLRLPSLTHVFIQQNRLSGERPVFANKLESYQYHQNQFVFSSKRDL